MDTISFTPDMMREYAKGMPSWFDEGHAIWLRHTATDTELTMIADGIMDDDQLWYLINQLIASYTAKHLEAKANGSITTEED